MNLPDNFFRHYHVKITAVLVRYFGLPEVEIAEDIAQDTLLEAFEKWSAGGVPNNPGGWLMDVAKKKTINLLKRNQTFQKKVIPELLSTLEEKSFENDSALQMIFVCCHPSLSKDHQIPLALKTLCGLSVAEIANALLTSESTINKRLYRAKRKFKDGSISFQLPEDKNLKERLDGIYTTLYLLFNEGYYSKNNENIIRADLCYEAIRLLKQTIKSFPNSSKGKALLSLMLLSFARFESRMDANGALVILEKQNRTLWDKELIAEGIDYLHQSARERELSAYHLQAGIAAEHCLASDIETTNWKSIYDQYLLLEQITNNEIVLFNKIIAKFYANNKQQALAEMIQLKKKSSLKNEMHLCTSIGVFLKDLGRISEAKAYFEEALNYTRLDYEKELIANYLKQY